MIRRLWNWYVTDYSRRLSWLQKRALRKTMATCGTEVFSTNERLEHRLLLLKETAEESGESLNFNYEEVSAYLTLDIEAHKLLMEACRLKLENKHDEARDKRKQANLALQLAASIKPAWCINPH